MAGLHGRIDLHPMSVGGQPPAELDVLDAGAGIGLVEAADGAKGTGADAAKA